MLKVGFVGWRGMVGSVLMGRMLEENDYDGIEPVFFSTSQAGQAGPDIGKDVPALQAVGLEGAFGTAVLSWVAKKQPDLVRSLSFLDPINFLLYRPQVVSSLRQHREPNSAVEAGTPKNSQESQPDLQVPVSQ